MTDRDTPTAAPSLDDHLPNGWYIVRGDFGPSIFRTGRGQYLAHTDGFGHWDKGPWFGMCPPYTEPVALANLEVQKTAPPAQSADDEREARLRHAFTLDDLPFLWSQLDAARADLELAREESRHLRATNNNMTAGLRETRDRYEAEVERLRAPITVWEQKLGAALAEADKYRVALRHEKEFHGKLHSQVARLEAELARLRSPPGADAVGIATTLWAQLEDVIEGDRSDRFAPNMIAHAIEAAKASGWEAAIDAAAQRLLDFANIADPSWETQQKFKLMIEAIRALKPPPSTP